MRKGVGIERKTRGEEEVGDKMQEHKCNSHKTKSQTEKIIKANKRRHNETMLPCQQHATSQGQTDRTFTRHANS